jgi:RHS repeat-associated protein
MGCLKLTYNHYAKSPFLGVWTNSESKSISGVGWYDFGARNYDPSLGMWFNVDPMAEMYHTNSPYHFCANDPVNNREINGMAFTPRFVDPWGGFGDGGGISGGGTAKGAGSEDNNGSGGLTGSSDGGGGYWEIKYYETPVDWYSNGDWTTRTYIYEMEWGWVPGSPNTVAVSNSDGVSNSGNSGGNEDYHNQYEKEPKSIDEFVERFDGMTYEEIMLGEQ